MEELLNLPFPVTMGAENERKTLTGERGSAIMNGVQNGGRFMNTVVTSREAILAMSRKMLREQGWTAVSVRSVAAACGISVGSIYNYFDSKEDLMSSVVESIWQEIFPCSEGEPFESVLSCVNWMFASMERGEEQYPGFFTWHSLRFMEEEKPSGRRRMAQAWEHMQRGLTAVLQQDKAVRQDAFDETFTPEGCAELIFSLLLGAMVRRNFSCDTILETIRRTIY